MSFLDNLQGIFGGGSTPATAGAGASGGGLGSMLNSGAMGGIAQTLLGNKRGGVSWLKTALVAGAGTMLWKKLANRMEEANAANPAVATGGARVQSPPDVQASRLVRALVFASKADGHLDSHERSVINEQIHALNIGSAGEDLVKQAMNEPLDPRLVADGVTDPEEALQLYALSSAVIDPDQFMERTYLDALAHELNIPNDVQDQIDAQMRATR